MKPSKFVKILAFVLSFSSLSALDVSEVMPRDEDFVSMWWQDGFPGVVPEAPWNRCIRSGSYGFVLDTETLEIPFLGSLSEGGAEEDWVRGDRTLRAKGQSARLDLRLSVNGKQYRCVKGGKWTKHEGPRLIESGRFLQRGDVTGLEFVSEDGSKLNVEAQLETVAWSDRLGLILTASPGDPRGEKSTEGLWKETTIELSLQGEGSEQELSEKWTLPKGERWRKGQRQKVALVIDLVAMKKVSRESPVLVRAHEVATGDSCRVSYEHSLSSHRISLDQVEAIPRPGSQKADNDVLERVKVVLSNPTEGEEMARLVFERSSQGRRHSFGSWITGVTAMLRDSDGNPIGVPVQLSKNWHRDRQAGTYQGSWFHGVTQLRLPPKSSYEFEFTVCYGHWGGLPAASHAQLSLIGWGQNQLWDQSALGSWGESICYDPEQVNARCTITDVRPLMVTGMKRDAKWGWTNNVGGGDFFRLFMEKGKRSAHRSMRAIRHRQGPCLTEVTYVGKVVAGLKQSATVSLGRTDDVVRGTYRIRLDVTQPVDFDRFVIFQTGADTYLTTKDRCMALGNETGLLKEWKTTWGGNINRTEPLECRGKIPWIALLDPLRNESTRGALANRGVIIREWKARLGGEDASPWLVERGSRQGASIDLVPPPGVTQLQPGDFVEATIEHIVMPQFAEDYYGSNERFRTALEMNENCWRMFQREVIGNKREVVTKAGILERTFPDVRIQAQNDTAEFSLTRSLGFVPVTITGLSAPDGHRLLVDGEEFDQTVHGSDFWQTDFDSKTQTWSRTYNLPATGSESRIVRFEKHP